MWLNKEIVNEHNPKLCYYLATKIVSETIQAVSGLAIKASWEWDRFSLSVLYFCLCAKLRLFDERFDKKTRKNVLREETWLFNSKDLIWLKL